MSRSKCGALLIAALVVMAAQAARAENPVPLYIYDLGYTSQYGMEHVPYYALHPPVYYSYPVARPYGYSPFAYPPGTMTPELTKPAPQEIINPFVPQPEPKKAKPASDRASVTPQVIINPYVMHPAVAPPTAE